MKIEEINKLYNESKQQIARQPKYDVHDEIRNLRDELKRKNDKILILTTTSNMYQVEAIKIKKIIAGEVIYHHPQTSGGHTIQPAPVCACRRSTRTRVGPAHSGRTSGHTG